MLWHDVFAPHDPTQWLGLRRRVSGAGRPGFWVSAHAPSHVRVALSQQPLLWARIDPDHYGYELLRGSNVGVLSILPPLRFESVREHAACESPRAAWATTFARLLSDSRATPLYDREWFIRALSADSRPFVLPAPTVREVVEQSAARYVDWDIGHEIYPITLRDMSAPDAGRVKAWRKQVASGTLPPVLLYWISGLDAHVVLDGHDRLLAASLEQASVPALALEPSDEVTPSAERQNHVTDAVATALEASQRATATARQGGLARAFRPFTVDDGNRLLINVFTPRQSLSRTRAWPLAGGLLRWSTEVRAALAARRLDYPELLA